MAPSRRRVRSSPRSPPPCPYNLRRRPGRNPSPTNLVSRDSRLIMSLPPPPPPLNTTTAPLPQTTTTAPLGPNPRRRASPPLPTGRRRCRGPPRPSSHSTEGRRRHRRSCCCSTTTPRALPGRCGRPPPRRWGGCPNSRYRPPRRRLRLRHQSRWSSVGSKVCLEGGGD